MAISPPSLMLKIIWLTHFILSTWALYNFISANTYWYSHVAVLAFGFWAIVSNESTDAVLMFMITLLFTILNDIIVLAIYEPRQHDIEDKVSKSVRNESRFALGMCITNLIIKPVTSFLLFRIYQSRSQGTELDTGIPGLGQSTYGGNRGAYSNIDEGNYGKAGEAPQYQPPNYQEAPAHSSSP